MRCPIDFGKVCNEPAALYDCSIMHNCSIKCTFNVSKGWFFFCREAISDFAPIVYNMLADIDAI